MSTPTRADVRHLAANRIAVISGRAQLIANDPTLPALVRHKVAGIDKEARRFFDDLMAMFKDDNSHLGAVESTGKRKE